MKRRYTAPPDDQRCRQDITLRGDGPGEGARCMRRAVVDGMCRQHAEMARDSFCAYCGGNDETPPDHTADCARPAGVPPSPAPDLNRLIADLRAASYKLAVTRYGGLLPKEEAAAQLELDKADAALRAALGVKDAHG
jgi:hypothetical protein